jgi:site-specific recombinase XerD
MSRGHCDGWPVSKNPGRPLCSLRSGSTVHDCGFRADGERVGEVDKLGFKAHPHMLRHACGFALANKGHDTRALQAYLGHRNIQHTVRYTEPAPGRFKDFSR